MGFFEKTGFGFLLFFYIYSINFTFLPAYSSQLIAAAALLFWGFTFLQKGDLEFYADRGERIVLSLWIILFLWVLLRTILTGFRDLSLLINTFLLLIQVFVGALFLTMWLFRRGFSFTSVIRFIQVIIVIQGLFIIVYFFSWDFKEFTLLFIPEGGNLPALHPFRSRGLTHGAGAKLAALQASGVLLTAYLMLKIKNRGLLIFDILCVGILMTSVFMTGRTGFFIIPVVLAFYFVYMLGKNLIPKKIVIAGVVLPFLAIGAYFLIQIIFQAYIATEFDYNVFRSFTRWAFGEFEDLATTGSSRTVDVLINQHLFFPDEAGLFLIGDPTTYELNRVDSDIGVVRRIFGIGFIGLIMTYLFVGSVFVQMYRAVPHFTERLLIVFFAIWIFVLEVKEPFVTDFRFASVYLMMFCYLCLMPLQDFNRFKLKH